MTLIFAPLHRDRPDRARAVRAARGLDIPVSPRIDPMSARARAVWTFAITSLALFMFALDRLVVVTALPVIRGDLSASLEGLEWTVNAYTLTFAVLLPSGAALGDRFGRRRLFVIGVALFTAGSAAAALAPSIGVLVAARGLQGVGGAILTPLTLTILSAAVPAEQRGRVLGAWGGIGGLAAALGPLIGGVLTEQLSWQWIFWLNVPLGLVLIPLARLRLAESHGPHDRIDVPGVVLASAALLALVWALVHGTGHGWHTPEIAIALCGPLLLVTFVAWEQRAGAPMLPMRFFANRTFAAANAASLLAYLGLFGSLFLITQFLQTALGYSPTEAGLRTLPWAAMPMLFIPAAGALSDRLGVRPLMAGGLALEAIGFGWLAALAAPDVPYPSLVPALVLVGVGSACFFAPVQSAVLGAVRTVEQGQASGATIAIRQLAGVLGVAPWPRSSPATVATARPPASSPAIAPPCGSAPPPSAPAR